MKTSTEVVVHINEALDQKKRSTLTDKIIRLSGVLSASVNETRPHLMIVGFDPAATRTQEVLGGVNRAGVHAQLVGWL